MIKKILQRRREKEYVKRALAVGAGIAIEPVKTPIWVEIQRAYVPMWDLLWGATAVIAPIVFALAVIIRVFH